MARVEGKAGELSTDALRRHWQSAAGPELFCRRPTRTATPARVPAADADTELASLQAEAEACRACALHEGRDKLAFADGSPTARVFFVGEGPGAEEDRQGVPFVGRAGQLLTDIIQKGMGLARGEVYIANVVKCRPPGNRNPLPAEAEACERFLAAQIRLVAPEILVCLGAVAARQLLRTSQGAGRLRGRLHRYEASGNPRDEAAAIPLVVTWHPAYLLRNPAAKRETWEDVKLVLRTLGMSERPPASGTGA